MNLTVAVSDADAQAIAQHEAIFPHVSDDFTPQPGHYERPGAAQGWINAVVYADGAPAAYMTLVPHSRVTADGHFAVLPEYRKQRIEIGRTALDWVKENTPFIKLTGQVASESALGYLLDLGFEVEGVNKNSLLRGGAVLSQTYVGIELCRAK